MADAVVSLLPSGMNDRLSVHGMGEGDNSPGPSTPPALRRGTALLGIVRVLTPEGWGLGSRADSQSIGKRGSRGPEKREGSGECTNAHPPSLVLGKQGEAYGGVEDEEQQWWAALGWLQGQTGREQGSARKLIRRLPSRILTPEDIPGTCNWFIGID